MADQPAPAAPTPTPPQPPPPPVSEPLGEPGLRALQAEREQRAEAERQMREFKRERDALAAQLSDADRAKLEADEQKRRADKAIKNLRQANLELALAGHGLTGPKAKAATRLIEGVEYDDDFRPTNLDTRLSAARELYGSEFFGGSSTPTPPAPAPSSAQPAPTPAPPADFHNGARPSAPEADEDQRFAAHMNHYFPGALPQQPAKT